MTKTTGVTSPCTNICSLNECNICVGCYRSLEEIACWSKATDPAKQDMLAKVRQRIALAAGQNTCGKI